MASRPDARGYVVWDANGQVLAYVYSRDNATEALQARMLTKDEARRIAINMARPPEYSERRTAIDLFGLVPSPISESRMGLGSRGRHSGGRDSRALSFGDPQQTRGSGRSKDSQPSRES
jgi:hypothetical protein